MAFKSKLHDPASIILIKMQAPRNRAKIMQAVSPESNEKSTETIAITDTDEASSSTQLFDDIINEGPMDKQAGNWVDRYAPKVTVPWLRLIRADRPIGIWLLLLPCYFGLSLAAISLQNTLSTGQFFYYALLFAVGAIVMRGAGCVYNDILDRDIDAQVARTALRPIPAKQVSVKGAILFLIALCLIGFLVLIQLNFPAIIIGLASLLLVAAYPLMKRITWWPQVWLGFTFNWGVLVGYAALAGTLSPASIILYGASIFWTIGYDTIYAHQDRDDDSLVGVKSSARRLGDQTRFWLWNYYGATIALTAIALSLSGVKLWVLIGLVPASCHLFWQITHLDINNHHNCLKMFKANRETGFLLLLPYLITVA